LIQRDDVNDVGCRAVASKYRRDVRLLLPLADLHRVLALVVAGGVVVADPEARHFLSIWISV
jgi:hypothetical protein